MRRRFAFPDLHDLRFGRLDLRLARTTRFFLVLHATMASRPVMLTAAWPVPPRLARKLPTIISRIRISAAAIPAGGHPSGSPSRPAKRG